MTPNQIAQCKLDEGLMLQVYDDANGALIVPGYRLIGHPTIGYGRALDTSEGITYSEADLLFSNDLLNVQRLSSTYSWIIDLDPVRRGVIEVMIFNIGLRGVMEFENMIASIRRKDWNGARVAMLDSKWALEVHERANRLANQIVTGEDVAPI
jgi:lysozyme